MSGKKLPLKPVIALILTAVFLHAQPVQTQYISVGEAKARKSIIALPEIRLTSPSIAPSAKKILDTLEGDLTFTDLFKIMGKAAYVENTASAGIEPGTFKMTDWSSIGTDFLVKTALTLEQNALTLTAFVYETKTAKEVFRKNYVGVPADTKALAHALATDIVKSLTGQDSVFFSKIAMICDRGGSNKEVYLMDFDGSNVKQLTQHRSIVLSPSWNKDGSKLAYSVYTRRSNNLRNIDLFEFDFRTEKIRVLSNRLGGNIGASYSPVSEEIALTMSFTGNSEIFSFAPSTGQVTRLTRSFGTNVDPSWSPDGKKILFVSDRTGVPMVFNMNADGSDVKRLTFAGRYNASPNWSPKGDKIVFSGWIDGRFDIFTMNPDGTLIERLTKQVGNNEDPSFSPDGNFIVFSSNRTSQKNIYVMNTNGSFVRRLTYGLGNCVTPRWANLAR